MMDSFYKHVINSGSVILITALFALITYYQTSLGLSQIITICGIVMACWGTIETVFGFVLFHRPDTSGLIESNISLPDPNRIVKAHHPAYTTAECISEMNQVIGDFTKKNNLILFSRVNQEFGKNLSVTSGFVFLIIGNLCFFISTIVGA